MTVPRKPRPRVPFEIQGTLDIECSEWDRFQVAATYDGKDVKIYYDGDQMLDDLCEVGGTWIAHAGGVYDILYCLERARVRGIPCRVDRSQHRVTRAVFGNLVLRDSYALWPVPLDEICAAIRRPVPTLPWPCVCQCTCAVVGCGVHGKARAGACGRGCGGYCRISEKASQGDPELEDYVTQDVVCLFDGFQVLSKFTRDHQITLRGTLGQTAWISARDEIGLPKSDMPYNLWRHARRADKGGRVAVVRPLATGPGAHHDICNAYPSQLRHAQLPVGGCYELGGDNARLAFDTQRPGIYTLSVTVPDDLFLPPLPWSKAGQLTFPTGDFSGSWVLPEVIAAMERGVQITAVHSALVWDGVAPIFGDLVERWYEVRRSVGRRTPLGSWIGRMAKAFTGKLAERPDRQRAEMYVPNVKLCARLGACSGRGGCTKRCGAYEQLDLYGNVWGIPYSKMPESAYPQWSAYLRAMTRVQWLSQAERMGEVRMCSACGADLGYALTCVDHPAATVSRSNGGRALCLGNTDSLWHTSRQTPEPLGDGLGEWEFQHAWTDLEVRSANAYAYRDPAGSGQLQIRGVPGLTEEQWRRGSGTIDRGVVTFGAAVKTTHGLFYKRSRKWSLPASDRRWYGDRKLGSDGLTYPATADELRELAQQAERTRAERAAVQFEREDRVSRPRRRDAVGSKLLHDGRSR